MLASYNPDFGTVSESKRDSMCSIVSVNTALSLEFGSTPEDLLNDLDFDDVSTNAASAESSPAKDKYAALDMDEDGNMPSRKRRAERFEEPSFRAEDALAALGDSSKSLFVPDDVVESGFETELFMNDFRPELADDDSAMHIDVEAVERSRSQSSERRRIQSELLSRLERLDGIELEEPGQNSSDSNSTEIKLDNDGQPSPDQSEPRLGIYNEKQRVDRLNAYREKRKQRVYGRVRYVLRQKVSESRPRIKGRFVKQTPGDQSTASPDSTTETRDHESSTSTTASPSSATTSTSLESPVRRVEFRIEPEESPTPKRGRTAWEMFKNLSLLSPLRSAAKSVKDKRPSLPTSFSEKLLMARRKSTTAASTASGKARRKFSRDEFFDDVEVQVAQEPQRKRVTSLKTWN